MAKKNEFPIEIKNGSATVKIYRTPSKGHESFTVLLGHGKRKRPR
jgi:hypothetical protein